MMGTKSFLQLLKATTVVIIVFCSRYNISSNFLLISALTLFDTRAVRIHSTKRTRLTIASNNKDTRCHVVHPAKLTASIASTTTTSSTVSNYDDDIDEPKASRSPVVASTLVPKTYPLASHTFAGMVEEGIIEKFGFERSKRIIESWRLLAQEYIHDVIVNDSVNSNMRQYCHSFVPGLSIRPFWKTDNISWCNELASKYQSIKDEFDDVTSDMEKLQTQGNNIWAGALTEDAGSYGVGWRTLVLMDRGIWDPVNVNLFPKTSKIIHDLDIPCSEVFFASMKPNSAIKLHSDFTNFVLTCHLGLHIPYSGQNKCRLTVGDTTRQWLDGEVLLFDTSLMHDAVNDSDQTRYILMLRVWHPDLTPTERAALQFTFNCLENPNLLSADPVVRSQAEQVIQNKMEFPSVTKRSSSSRSAHGFGNKTAKQIPKTKSKKN